MYQELERIEELRLRALRRRRWRSIQRIISAVLVAIAIGAAARLLP
jgi:LPS O-antigen subunit length determinant protein (WzzB/FepE family)